jgi:hypothetical protein
MAKTFCPNARAQYMGYLPAFPPRAPPSSAGMRLQGAQVHLANTLDAELEGTGVIAYTIGPGLVPTSTAREAVGACPADGHDGRCVLRDE